MKKIVFVLLALVVAGGGWFWQSPQRKIMGKWEMGGGPMLKRTAEFSWNGKCQITTQAAVLNAAVRSSEEMTYRIDSSQKPWTLELTPAGAKGGAEKLGIEFLNSDTIKASHTLGGGILNFEVSSEWRRVK